MSILNDVLTKSAHGAIKLQQQPKFPLRYDSTYGPYSPITSYEASLQQNFINLLMTNPGEWPMSPEMGVGLRHYLFELSSTDPFSGLQERISEQLTKYLPKIEIVELLYDDSPEMVEKNKTNITINYVILKSIGISTSFLADILTGNVEIIDVARSAIQSIELLNREISMISDVAQL